MKQKCLFLEQVMLVDLNLLCNPVYSQFYNLNSLWVGFVEISAGQGWDSRVVFVWEQFKQFLNFLASPQTVGSIKKLLTGSLWLNSK